MNHSKDQLQARNLTAIIGVIGLIVAGFMLLDCLNRDRNAVEARILSVSSDKCRLIVSRSNADSRRPQSFDDDCEVVKGLRSDFAEAEHRLVALPANVRISWADGHGQEGTETILAPAAQAEGLRKAATIRVVPASLSPSRRTEMADRHAIWSPTRLAWIFGGFAMAAFGFGLALKNQRAVRASRQAHAQANPV